MCNNPFIEEDGYCPLCGTNHPTGNRRNPASVSRVVRNWRAAKQTVASLPGTPVMTEVKSATPIDLPLIAERPQAKPEADPKTEVRFQFPTSIEPPKPQHKPVLMTFREEPKRPAFPHREAIEITVRLVAEEYGINNFEVRWTDCKKTYHHKDKARNMHVLTFGRPTIEWHSRDGFHEYASIRHILPNPAPKGEAAAIWCALHEAAHMIVSFRGQRQYGDVHGYTWQAVYAELRAKYL